MQQKTWHHDSSRCTPTSSLDENRSRSYTDIDLNKTNSSSLNASNSNSCHELSQKRSVSIDSLNIRSYFGALCSAQYLPYGKPHPHIFLNCADALQVLPANCLVIEDSVNGVIAGKAAQMRVAVIPEEENRTNPKFAIADYHLHSLLDFVK